MGEIGYVVVCVADLGSLALKNIFCLSAFSVYFTPCHQYQQYQNTGKKSLLSSLEIQQAYSRAEKGFTISIRKLNNRGRSICSWG